MVDGAVACTAFEGLRKIASGVLREVAARAKEVVDRGGPVLIFDDGTGEVIEVDFRGSVEDVGKRMEGKALPAAEAPGEAEARKPGRPRLGVVAREVTMLPRHWDWLNSQPGGTSVALRKLVEDARRVNVDRDKQRVAQEAAYRFLSAMAGNQPGFEEAARALFAGRQERFAEVTAVWPLDLREYAMKLAGASFAVATNTP
jgi:uncharacterized protein